MIKMFIVAFCLWLIVFCCLEMRKDIVKFQYLKLLTKVVFAAIITVLVLSIIVFLF